MTPRATATPIPAFAPSLSPEDDPCVCVGVVVEVLEVEEVELVDVAAAELGLGTMKPLTCTATIVYGDANVELVVVQVNAVLGWG